MSYGQGKHAEAEQFLKKAVAIYVADLGEDHPDVARCTSKLGRVCLSQDHKDEAEKCCQRAVGIYERTGGDIVDRATALEDYAAVLRKTGNDAKAQELETRARSLRESLRKP